MEERGSPRYRTLRQLADVRRVEICCARCSNSIELTVATARSVRTLHCPECLGAMDTSALMTSVERIEDRVWAEHQAGLNERRTRAST